MKALFLIAVLAELFALESCKKAIRMEAPIAMVDDAGNPLKALRP